MDNEKLSSYFKEFDELGESFVRSMIASDGWGSYDKPKHGAAVEWARHKDEERALTASSRRDTREERTLTIAEEANRLASRANRIAMIAVIIAVIAITRSTIWDIIQWLLNKIMP